MISRCMFFPLRKVLLENWSKSCTPYSSSSRIGPFIKAFTMNLTQTRSIRISPKLIWMIFLPWCVFLSHLVGWYFCLFTSSLFFFCCIPTPNNNNNSEKTEVKLPQQLQELTFGQSFDGLAQTILPDTWDEAAAVWCFRLREARNLRGYHNPQETDCETRHWKGGECSRNKNLGGGSKYFLFSPLLGEMIQFD